MTLAAGAALLADSDTGKGSPIGLLVVLILVVAVYFLWRSMNRHLGKVPGRFDRRGSGRPDTQPPGTERPGTEPPGTERPGGASRPDGDGSTG
ncbi:MAG TPA: hypothetical protein VMB79_05165 [Jatrophihabitans sp.]|nr:hypothetical protein [Jatrophihabitans sp.]